jgi:Mg-chelatase subunit ChlD
MTQSTDLVATKAALDQLNKSLERSSLDDLVQARTRRSLLLVDCSGSMSDRVRTGARKIDALRKVVETLRTTHPVPLAAFGISGDRQVDVVDAVPEPSGGTPLDLAIDFGAEQGATHLVVVTDGQPNDEDAAFESARKFGGPIDVFYIGDGNDRGSKFAAKLAAMTGGSCGLTDLVGAPKVLANKIILMIGDGSDSI